MKGRYTYRISIQFDVPFPDYSSVRIVAFFGDQWLSCAQPNSCAT